MVGPSIWECILRLSLSALFGGIIGIERQIRLKWAGFRTHLIVSFASCMMMLVSKYGFYDVIESPSVNMDPGRIAAGIVTAIGFLGAGTIFSRAHGATTGLTTAAGLWATVGIGMTVGAGMYPISVFSTVFIVVVQALLHRDHVVWGHLPSIIVVIQMEDRPDALERLQSELTRLKIAPVGSRFERSGGMITVELQVEKLSGQSANIERLLPLLQEPYVKSVTW